MADAADERGRHLDERRRQHVGEHERPGPAHRLRAAACQRQPVAEAVDGGVLGCDPQRVVVDVDA